MLSKKEYARISKFLSLVLRHKPEQIELELDMSGWADVNSLIEKCNCSNIPLTREALNFIVETNPKRRFAYNNDQTKIRASQGHSIHVELGLGSIEPPAVLYHGTAELFVPAIWSKGLLKQQRQHVHLSSNVETALSVGRRHGEPYVFEILAKQMYVDGYDFFIYENGVWLTDNVPVQYLREFSLKINNHKKYDAGKNT